MTDYEACPFCGSTLAIRWDEDGTCSYVPVDARRIAEELDRTESQIEATVARFRQVNEGLNITPIGRGAE